MHPRLETTGSINQASWRGLGIQARHQVLDPGSRAPEHHPPLPSGAGTADQIQPVDRRGTSPLPMANPGWPSRASGSQQDRKSCDRARHFQCIANAEQARSVVVEEASPFRRPSGSARRRRVVSSPGRSEQPLPHCGSEGATGSRKPRVGIANFQIRCVPQLSVRTKRISGNLPHLPASSYRSTGFRDPARCQPAQSSSPGIFRSTASQGIRQCACVHAAFRSRESQFLSHTRN